MTHSSSAAVSRIRKRQHAAKRALAHAIANGERLTAEQVKLAVAEYNAMGKTVVELTAQSNKWPTQDPPPSPHQMEALMKRATELTARAQAISAHPQVKAVRLNWPALSEVRRLAE